MLRQIVTSEIATLKNQGSWQAPFAKWGLSSIQEEDDPGVSTAAVCNSLDRRKAQQG
jgi:hypothetical protein